MAQDEALCKERQLNPLIKSLWNIGVRAILAQRNMNLTESIELAAY